MNVRYYANNKGLHGELFEGFLSRTGGHYICNFIGNFLFIYTGAGG